MDQKTVQERAREARANVETGRAVNIARAAPQNMRRYGSGTEDGMEELERPRCLPR